MGKALTRGLAACALAAAVLAPTAAQARLQCVTYARSVSGIELFGRAASWWGQAEGVYARGSAPREGAVMAFASTRAMPAGHVAMVAKVIDSRHVLLDHANWSTPGGIEHSALAEDVSAQGDWSEVRVWHKQSGQLGQRVNPVQGFIYPTAPDAVKIAENADVAQAPALVGSERMNRVTLAPTP